MEFPFPISELFNIDKNGFIILTSKDLSRNMEYFGTKNPLKTKLHKLQYIFDEIGNASSKAQGLSTTITNYSRFAYSNHKIFMKADGNAIIGYIKIGIKNLIYCDRYAKMKELAPMCVLDFYVHESVQRHGYGKKLFEYMLINEQIEPFQLAIDRPSNKFLSFLKKHYSLCNYTSQPNNFVIFHEFFEKDEKSIQKLKDGYKNNQQNMAKLIETNSTNNDIKQKTIHNKDQRPTTEHQQNSPIQKIKEDNQKSDNHYSKETENELANSLLNQETFERTQLLLRVKFHKAILQQGQGGIKRV